MCLCVPVCLYMCTTVVTGDAGLKAHITEDYVLDLTGHLACSACLLPVLVELWIGHLEHLLRGVCSCSPITLMLRIVFSPQSYMYI